MNSTKINENHAISYNLGKLGNIVQFTPPNNTTNSSQPAIIFILDRSSSMGEHVERLIKSLGQSLRKLNFPDYYQIRVITFDDIAERLLLNGKDPTVKDLCTMSLRQRGCTYMVEVFSKIEEVFKEVSTSTPILIIAISDGGIYDQSSTIETAQRVCNNMPLRQATVSVSLIRLGSSGNTQALSYIGSFATNGKIPVLELSFGSIIDYTKVICECIENHIVPTVQISASEPILRRSPFDEPSLILIVPCGKSVSILVSPDVDIHSIRCDDIPINVYETEFHNEESINEFLNTILSKMKMIIISGINTTQLSETINWVTELYSMIKPIEPQVEGVSIKTSDRVKKLLVDINKIKKGVISQILELKNSDSVSNLNNAQQADFLNGTLNISSSKDKRLAKRVTDLNFDERCIIAINSLPYLSGISELKKPEVSYISQETIYEMIQSSLELVGQSTCATVQDILPIIGGLGIAFNLEQSSLPNPWDVYRYMREVYPSGMYLSESDICQAMKNADFTLQSPGMGPNARIVGVVPLPSLSPSEVSKSYNNGELSSIAQFHASRAMRGIIAPVPYDTMALATAVLSKLCEQINGRPPTELEQFIISDLKKALQMVMNSYGKETFSTLAMNLMKDDPRPYLTGDSNDYLKSFAVFLAYPKFKITTECLQAVYGLQVAQCARYEFGAMCVQERLFTILNIDLYTTRVSLSPLFEVDTPFDPMTVTAPNLTKLIVPQWMPPISLIMSIVKFSTEDKNNVEFNVHHLQLIMAIEAALFPKEAIRINKTTMTANFPKYGNIKKCSLFIYKQIVMIYKDDYEQRQSLKAAEEASILINKLINELLSEESIQLFLDKLQQIPSRSAIGYTQLEDMLLDININVPLRSRKIWLIVLGRNIDGEPVWADGNVMIASSNKWRRIREVYDAREKFSWNALNNMRQIYGMYKYRDTKHNRHGHGNEKPSYWAMGYMTIEQFKDDVDEETFKDYRSNHTTCCGFFKYY